MPNYGTLPLTGSGSGVPATALMPGDRIALFNAETPMAPQSSIAIARGRIPGGGPASLVFSVAFANASPTAVVAIQGANVDTDGQYQTLSSVTNAQFGYYADVGDFAFYRAQLVSGSGGALTVIAQ